MDKLKLAHDWYMKHSESASFMYTEVDQAWQYADAMQAEADKRNKAEAEQKRKEIREMLNAPNTFIEREGQHFDDVEEWQPDWSQAPEDAKYWAMDKDGSANFFKNKPEATNGNGWDFGGVMQSNNTHEYTGNWKDSLRKRPEALCEVDWSVAPSNADFYLMRYDKAVWSTGFSIICPAPSFGFTGTHIVERPHHMKDGD